MNIISYPQYFRIAITQYFGDEGAHWLKQLPTQITQLATRYQLSELHTLDNLSFHYVAAGSQHGKPIILKLGLDVDALTREAHALQLLSSSISPRVIAADPGMIIMQRATPGTTLTSFFPDNDSEATEIFCHCLRRIHATTISQPHNFLKLDTALNLLDKELDIPESILGHARALKNKLLNTSQQTVLLHGDLHHDNILKNNDEWLVIDPKGFIGDPGFDLCTYIYNPIPQLLQQSDPSSIINNRIHRCAQLLDLSAQYIRDWLIVKTVLSWAWCLEDNSDPAYFESIYSIITT